MDLPTLNRDGFWIILWIALPRGHSMRLSYFWATVIPGSCDLQLSVTIKPPSAGRWTLVLSESCCFKISAQLHSLVAANKLFLFIYRSQQHLLPLCPQGHLVLHLLTHLFLLFFHFAKSGTKIASKFIMVLVVIRLSIWVKHRIYVLVNVSGSWRLLAGKWNDGK